MIVLGLTGSIGMGKSTVAAMFADEGVPVFDADAAVHRLQGPEGALVEAIEAHFPGTTGAAGVDRTSLAEAVLGDSAKLRRLEAMIHPAVARERQAFLAEHRDAPLVVLDIPLLFEKGGSELVREARRRELTAVNGLEMLIGQARASFEHFFGVRPPLDKDEELLELLTR